MRRPVALLLAVVLLLGGGALAWSSLRPAPPEGLTAVARPDDGTARRPPTRALAPYYSQRLTWTACGDHQCARLEVPLDYRRPQGRTLSLTVLQVPAEAQRIGSLVVDPGGPGAPATTYAASGTASFGHPLLDHYDVVGMDPRGVGTSDPVDCLGDRALTTYLSTDPDPRTAAERRTWVGEQRRLARGCVRRSGDLAAHVSTAEAARDLDILRAALDESRLDYFGASYGTELGAAYASLFPRRVGRFVLDGAVDPTLGPVQLARQQAGGFQTALRAYLQSCVDAGSCFLGPSVDAAEARLGDFLAAVERQPLTASDGSPVPSGNVYLGISAALYDKSTWFALTLALRQALNGDGSSLQLLSDAYTQRRPDGSYTSNLMEAFPAISCLDDPRGLPPSRVPGVIPSFEKVSPTFGRVFAWSLVTCDGWPVHSDLPAVRVRATGAAPIVVVGTTRDPATPYRWSVHLADALHSGVLVTRDGDGHTGYHQGNACVDRVVEGYLVAGTPPTGPVSC